MSQDAFNQQVVVALKNITDCFERLETRIKALETPDLQPLFAQLLLAHEIRGTHSLPSVLNEMSVAECMAIRDAIVTRKQLHAEIIAIWGLWIEGRDNWWTSKVVPAIETRIERANYDVEASEQPRALSARIAERDR